MQTLKGILLAAVVVVAGCGGGETLPAQVVAFQPSETGRLEVTIEITNTAGEFVTPECDVDAKDADEFGKGGDLVEGNVLEPDETATYSGVTGIDAEGVAFVDVECWVS